MELLILLVERQGKLVSRDEIAERLWGKGVFLDVEHGINTAVRKIRLILRDDSENPRFLETVVGKGYRFSAPVTCSSAEIKPPAATELKPNVRALPQPTSADTPVVMATRNTLSNRAWLPAAGATLLALIVVASFLLFIRHQDPKPPALSAVKSLAVLPLKNLSGDPSQEYLVDGMTEALIGRLSAIQDLRVVSRTSSMHFKDTQLSTPEIAAKLHVDALVEGSVIREGGRIRVHAQLIRVATDDHLWSETYDRDLTDVLSLQSDVAQAIARRVEATVTGKEQERLVAARPVSPEVYEAYLKGRFTLQNMAPARANVEKSVHYFEDAVRNDPAFAPAYVGLATAHSELGTIMIGGDPKTERPQVVSAARRALQLDPNLAEAHVLLADTAREEWDWVQAEAEYRRALELNPNDSDAYRGLAGWLLCQGRMDEALAAAQRARELDRLGSSTQDIAWILFHSRRYEEAVRELRSALAVRPNDADALWLLGFILVVKGQANEAIPLLEKAANLANRDSGFIDVLAAAYARADRRYDALRILDELKKRKQRSYVPTGSFVIVYLGLGEDEQALAWLGEAYKERSNILQFVKVHPLMDPLRNDPRFADLVRRVGLG